MKNCTFTASLVALLAVTTVTRSQEPQMPAPQKEHDWLKQLAGEWESESEITTPGQPPIKSKGKESARMIGGFWLVAENTGDFMGTPFTGILTLGYDAQKKYYVGTWIDSVQGYLWTYHGEVDAAGKKLTLHTEGPSHTAPGKLANFREVIEIKSDDEKVFTSEMQTEDGAWTKLVTANYRRKK
jgi:hypothetical protein